MKKIYLIAITLLLTVILISCNSIGFMRDNVLPLHIDSFYDFIKVYVILQVSIFFISFVFRIFMGKNLSRIITYFLHWLWLVDYRDYGFWTVLCLFFALSIFTFILEIIYFFSHIIFKRRE